MSVRNLRIYPDPILRKKCKRIERFDKDLARLMDDLAESMYAHQGVGLAASQIGVLQQALVVDVEQGEESSNLIEIINPEILEISKECKDFEEGCLSFPGEIEMLNRPAYVKVAACDREGRCFEIEAEGLLAIALQHEIDHLNGNLFIDHVSRLKRSLIDRRMKKRAKSAAS